MKMFQVDAFTSEVFKGNPAAVLVTDSWLDEALMLQIAAENNLSETAFVVRGDDGRWGIRWFTPTQEVDFCGHATLASSHVLATEYNAPQPMVFVGKVGELSVLKEAEGYRMDFPCFEPEVLEVLPPEIEIDAPVAICRNFENIFVELSSEAAVRTFEPDLPKLARLGRLGLVITAKGEDEFDFVSRYFLPGAGIPEDPVTGSIHSTLVPYWAQKLGKTELSAYQASARGGRLGCSLAGDRVILRGQAVTYMAGEIMLPGLG